MDNGNGGNGTGAELRQERQDLSAALAAQEGAQVAVEAEQAAAKSPASNRGKQNRRPEGRSSVEESAKDVLSDAEKLLGDPDNPDPKKRRRSLIGEKAPGYITKALRDGIAAVAEWLDIFNRAERQEKGTAAAYLWGKIELLEDVVNGQIERGVPLHVDYLRSKIALVTGPDWKDSKVSADVIAEAKAVLRDFEEHATPFTVAFLERAGNADRQFWREIKDRCEICHRLLTKEQRARRFTCCSDRCNGDRVARERQQKRSEEEAFKAKILGRSGAASSSSAKGGDVANQLGV